MEIIIGIVFVALAVSAARKGQWAVGGCLLLLGLWLVSPAILGSAALLIGTIAALGAAFWGLQKITSS